MTPFLKKLRQEKTKKPHTHRKILLELNNFHHKKKIGNVDMFYSFITLLLFFCFFFLPILGHTSLFNILNATGLTEN